MEKARRDKLLRMGGYGAFAFGSLLFSLYLTFPAEAVGQRVAHEITKSTGGKLSVTFGEIGLYRLTGFEAEEVKLHTTGEQPMDLTIDALRMRLSILPLLVFDLAGSAEIELGDGTIEADISPGAEDDVYDVALDFDDVNLASPPLLATLAGLPIRGKLGGSAEAQWSSDPRKSTGKASLTVREAMAGPGEIKGFTLPSVSLGQLDVAFDLRSGRLRLASFQQKGGDLSAKATASVALRPKMKESSLDACLEVRPTDDFLAKNPKIKDAMVFATAALRKDDDGYLHVPIGGTFASPRQRGGLCRRGGSGAGGVEKPGAAAPGKIEDE
jgi:type II secretion system protein N